MRKQTISGGFFDAMIRRPHLGFSYFWVFEKILIEFFKNWVSFSKIVVSFSNFSRYSSSFAANNNRKATSEALWCLRSLKVLRFWAIFSKLWSQFFRISEFLEKFWVFEKKIEFLAKMALSFTILSVKKPWYAFLNLNWHWLPVRYCSVLWS